jgi:hypothetical protein
MNKGMILVISILCLVIPALAETGRVPKFEQFPAHTYSYKLNGRVDLSNPAAYQFRTRLREGARQGANFVGHYTVVAWGCGTNCINGAIIDMFSGHVEFLPTVNTYQMEHENDSDF